MKKQTLPRQSVHFVDLITILWEKNFKKTRKEKEKARSAGASSNKNSDCPPRKFFRCGSADHLIAKCPKTRKDGEKKNGKKVSFQEKEKGNSAKK